MVKKNYILKKKKKKPTITRAIKKLLTMEFPPSAMALELLARLTMLTLAAPAQTTILEARRSSSAASAWCTAEAMGELEESTGSLKTNLMTATAKEPILLEQKLRRRRRRRRRSTFFLFCPPLPQQASLRGRLGEGPLPLLLVLFVHKVPASEKNGRHSLSATTTTLSKKSLPVVLHGLVGEVPVLPDLVARRRRRLLLLLRLLLRLLLLPKRPFVRYCSSPPLAGLTENSPGLVEVGLPQDGQGGREQAAAAPASSSSPSIPYDARRGTGQGGGHGRGGLERGGRRGRRGR